MILQQMYEGTMLCIEAMRHDPVMQFALAIDWLDLYAEAPKHHEDWDDYDFVPDTFEFWDLRSILRQHFPTLHAEFVWQYRYGEMTNEALVWHMMDKLNNVMQWHGEWFEPSQMGWLPINWLGAGMTEEWFDESCRAAWLAEAMAACGDNWGGDMAHNAAMQFDESTYLPAMHLMNWLFSRSRNSVVDMTSDEAGENGIYPTWNEYESVVEVYSEALEIHGAAIEYLNLLDRDIEVYHEFCTNVVIAYAHGIQKAFYSVPKHEYPDFGWDCAVGRTGGNKTNSEPRLLPAGDYPAAA